MASTITERFDSRTVNEGQSAELLYDVRDQADELTARTDVKAVAPATYDGMPRRRVDIERKAVNHWLATVVYSPNDTSAEEPPLADIGDSVFTFNTSGGTQRITQGTNVANYAPAGETAPDFKGAINVGPNGVEGIDVVVPAFEFTETHVVDDADVDAAYQLAVANLTGKFNNATFKGFPAKTVQFLGAQGTKRGVGSPWEISYSFRYSPNVTSLTVGTITGIDKSGNEVLWFVHSDEDDQDAGRITRRVTSAHVDRYADTASFTGLEIGT